MRYKPDNVTPYVLHNNNKWTFNASCSFCGENVNDVSEWNGNTQTCSYCTKTSIYKTIVTGTNKVRVYNRDFEDINKMYITYLRWRFFYYKDAIRFSKLHPQKLNRMYLVYYGLRWRDLEHMYHKNI
jgi:hypothetical protein